MPEDQSPKSPTVTITVSGIGVYKVPTGLNLREALRHEGVYLEGTCADRGTCGRCIVRVLDGKTQPPSEQERGILGKKSVEQGERLACRITVAGDIKIAVSRERILEVEKSGHWKAVWSSPLWVSSPFPSTGSGYGIALDLGTTSMAAALYDLDSGRPLDIRTAANPQTPWGEEIISRLAAAQDTGTAGTLRDLLWRKVNDIAQAMCLRSGVSPGRVSRIVAVGNSAVHHLSLGYPVGSLLTPPYDPFDAGGRDVPADEIPIQLELAADARIYFPPLAGGYAGSDALVSLLAALSGGVKRGAVIDVGTNTEIAVWDEDCRMVATAPSGPAFEGGHIKSGMQAIEGAIWKVGMRERKLNIEVIGGGQPKGICGTGIVDAIAVLLKNGIIDPSGLLRKGSHPGVSEKGFILDPIARVLIEPQDIETIQKAKGAIAAAFNILLERMNMEALELQQVYLAGAFGSRLDVGSAVSIGLLPRLAANGYVSAGNTALIGASMVLLSKKAREEVERLGRSIHHVSVAEDNRFEELFIDNLYF